MYIIDTPEISKKDIIYFDQGLPGFETYQNFVVMDITEFQPLKILYSCDKKELDLKFVIIESELVKNDYKYKFTKNDLKEIKAEKSDQVSLFFIVTIDKDDISQSTANLMGPLAINLHARIGKQLLVENYKQETKFRLFLDQNPIEGGK